MSGELDPGRWSAFERLRNEAADAERRRGALARQEERREGKRFSRMVREVDRVSPKRR